MKKILIIEDDELISTVYSAKYLETGYEARVAADGEEGLALVDTFKPDLIHLDLGVPRVNGVEVIKRIRSRDSLKSLPIVVLSNTYQNRMVKAALEAGATQCVSKATSTPRMMIEIVEKHLSRLIPPPPPGAAPDAVAPADPAGTPEEPAPDALLTSETPYTTRISRHASFQAEIQRGFLKRGPKKLAALRERVAPLFRSDDSTRVADLTELYGVINSFAGQAGIAGFKELSQMSYALVALLRELIERPEALTPSVVHTIVGASDFLSSLLERTGEAATETRAPVMVLVVDDDAVARRAVSLALARLNVATVCVEDPETALRLLAENAFSLIFLDIEMPGKNGFEVCRELRSLPAHQTTPVAFVSSLADDEARKSALASGGTDLIEKPFLPMELAVKALCLLR